jgi:hypothetical protein
MRAPLGKGTLMRVVAVVGLGVCLCVAAIVTLRAQQQALVLESGAGERAAENSFFDELAAKDFAKDRRSKVNRHISHQGKVSKPQLHMKGAQSPKSHPKLISGERRMAKPSSMRKEFDRAKEQLHEEQHKMRHLEEQDHVKAEEQKIELERVTADQQASAYESHLNKINSAVFPASAIDAEEANSHAVSHALTDDMHVPKITKADYEAHPLARRRLVHGSNRLLRRVRNSAKDFAKQVLTGKAVSHVHHAVPAAKSAAAHSKVESHAASAVSHEKPVAAHKKPTAAHESKKLKAQPSAAAK